MILPEGHITKNFTLAEVEFSDTAIRKGIDNRLPPELMDNVKRQAELMERVRYELNSPIDIKSWYRCHELNAAVGSSSRSFHPLGLATDFVSRFGTTLEICRALAGKLEFDQLIEEGTWVHIGLSPGPLRHEVLTATFKNGKVFYTAGLR